MALTDLMRHQADIYSRSYTIDNAGGRVASMSALAKGNLPCNIQPATSSIIAEYRQRDEVITHTMYWIDSSVVINISQRVTYSGKNYKVVGLKSDTQRGLWYRADLEIELAS